MPPDPQGVSHDRQRRIHGGTRWKKSAVNDIKIVYVVSLAVYIQHGRFRIVPKPNGPVLMCDTSQRNLLSEIQVSRKQSLVTFAAMDVAFSLVVHQIFELILQTLMSLDIVRSVRQNNVAVLVKRHAIIRTRQ